MRDEPPKIPLTERILHLRAIPVGALLPPPVLTIIATHLKERIFKKGHVLVRTGEPIGGLHLLVEGSLRLSSKGKQLLVMTPPQSFGFLAILARTESIYDAEFTEDSVTLELDSDALYELLEDHFALLFASLNYISERLLHELVDLPAEALAIPMGEDPGIPDHELDFIERIFFLRKMGVFSTANLNALAVMSTSLVETRAPAGTVLWTEGTTSDGVIMVVSGIFRCTTVSGKLFLYGPNTVIGGIEALAGKPHWYSLESETPVLFFKSNQEVFLDLIEENFAMASDFMGFTAQRLLQLYSRKADQGLSTLNVPREMPKLGRVVMGA
jgi:CRP-like cAMP-binding protein